MMAVVDTCSLATKKTLAARDRYRAAVANTREAWDRVRELRTTELWHAARDEENAAFAAYMEALL